MKAERELLGYKKAWAGLSTIMGLLNKADCPALSPSTILAMMLVLSKDSLSGNDLSQDNSSPGRE